MKGLAWHPLMYKLFYHRYTLRQWRERVGRQMTGTESGPLRLPDSGALAEWLQVSASVDAAPMAQEAMRLLERIVVLVQEAGVAHARGKTGEVCERLQRDVCTTSDALLATLDDMAVHLGTHGGR
ncbi:MAG TPA: hypothetical protein VGE12_04130 [Noviherbaspirillum sp.]